MDIDGEVVSYAWQQVCGRRVALDDAGSPNPSFVSGKREQRLFFLLKVTDDSGAIWPPNLWMDKPALTGDPQLELVKNQANR